MPKILGLDELKNNNNDNFVLNNKNIGISDNDVETLIFQNKGVIDGIADIFGLGGPTIDDGYSLLAENDIWYSKEEIKSVEKRGTDGENIVVIMENGEEYLFVPDGNGFSLSYIKLSDGTTVICDLSYDMQKRIREQELIPESVSINGVVTVNVDGREIKVYWVGDESFNSFKARVDNIKKAIVSGVFNFDSLTNDYGYNLLAKNGISVNRADIQSVDIISDSYSIVVTLKNGDKFLFAYNGYSYVLSSISLADGTIIYCNIPYDQEYAIKDIAGIQSDVDIKGYVTIEIEGHKTNVYWVGDDVPFNKFKEELEAIKSALDSYPSEVIDYIFEKSDFKGFFIGTFDSIDNYDSAEDASVIAFASKKGYIFINTKHPSFNVTDVIVHELGHIMDFALSDEDSCLCSDDDLLLQTYFDRYKKIIQQIDLTGYSSADFPEGVPSTAEFFAQIIVAYLEHPDDLLALIPEVYYYVEDLFGRI